MLLFVELCVDLRKGKLAKDGLYQYKNTAQNTNVGTIEVCSDWWSEKSLREFPADCTINIARFPKIHRTCRAKGH